MTTSDSPRPAQPHPPAHTVDDLYELDAWAATAAACVHSQRERGLDATLVSCASRQR